VKRRQRIVVLAGDGIGPEVTAEAVRVLQAVAQIEGIALVLEHQPFGFSAYEAYESCFPETTSAALVGADAVLLGAVGDPRADTLGRHERPEAALLELRQSLRCWANLRPTRVFDALVDVSPLRADRVRGTDVAIVRELGGDVYYGKPRGREGDRAFDTMEYSVHEVERVARRAFDLAMSRRRALVSVDKANVLESSRLWRETVTRVGGEYPEVALRHAYVDAFAAELVVRPNTIDVVVTGNLFGDILSDQLAAVAGSLGLMGSVAFGDGPPIFEPIHGSAPDIAGRGIANPTGAILSVAMLLEHSLGDRRGATTVVRAVERAVAAGCRTRDIGGCATTREFGDAVLRELHADVAQSRWTERTSRTRA
jgi:3-isopropylmalate dehydrogenase